MPKMIGDILAELHSATEHARLPNETLVDCVNRLVQENAHLRLDEVTLADILFGDETAGKGFRAIAAEMRTALGHLDAIIAAYRQPGLGPLINTVREAQEWRQAKTAQDASGAIQSP